MSTLTDIFQSKTAKALGVKRTKAALKLLHNVGMELMDEYDYTRTYQDVTGNLLNSFAVGIYNNGKLVEIIDASSVNRESPTRKTLRKGERYNLSAYYNGKPVRQVKEDGKSTTQPYVGEYGHGGQDGRMAARRSLQHRHPSGRFALLAVVATEYASFVQNKKGHDVLTSLSQRMPGIFNAEVVTI